ncbi:exopolyphosphatase [Rhizobium rhizosphaerae]|uniref:Exopolyphosphatase n=1 Tax=Xaviernesmea rhizosphaerae TaxID=1672749 RepID=A0A1Q9AHE2_9HYPH|nr:exopolyphosphatase [Xaviernesmea rhizosphaerae]
MPAQKGDGPRDAGRDLQKGRRRRAGSQDRATQRQSEKRGPQGRPLVSGEKRGRGEDARHGGGHASEDGARQAPRAEGGRRGDSARHAAGGRHDAASGRYAAGHSGASQAGPSSQSASGQAQQSGEARLHPHGGAHPGLANGPFPAHPAAQSGLHASSAAPGLAPRPAPRGADDARAPLYAALDLGTNNCRLLIAQPTRPGQFRVVDAFSRIVRLGEGLAATGRLSADAMDRAVEALKVCAAKLKTRDIRRMRLIATEAARAAENGQLFMERVAEETGLTLEIINRETEARLAVSGCSSLIERSARSVVLFDIGGGSSEIAVIRIGETRSNRLANHITHWTSLPVGVVTLSERHGGRDVTPESFEGMVREVEGMLSRFECPPIFEREDGADGFHLIGTSGTVTTLAGVHLGLPRYDRRQVDGLWLSDEEVSAMQARLLSWDFAARAANPCIGPDRADLVLAGCAILEAIRRRWPSRKMRVADRGLREGLLTDMMADDGAWRKFRAKRPGNQGQGGKSR